MKANFKKKALLIPLLAAALGLFFMIQAACAEVIAAAASLQPCLEKMVASYEKEKGVHIDTVFGASGNLAHQIEMGAPFDLFISADEKWATYLEQKGKLTHVKPVASCPLVLWWGHDKAPSLDLLKDPKIKVSIADPAVAPFGKSAQAYLQKVGLYDKLTQSSRLIVAGDILQAGLAAKSGGADVALVALSIAKKLGGSWTKVPVPPQTLYGGIVSGRNGVAVRSFWDYMRSDQARPFFEEAGFEQVR